MSSKKYHKNR